MGDYAVFERVLEATLVADLVRLLAYCLMPNHWHLLLRPQADGQLVRFLQRLTTTRVRRWQANRHGEGLVERLGEDRLIRGDRSPLVEARAKDSRLG